MGLDREDYPDLRVGGAYGLTGNWIGRYGKTSEGS